MAVTRREYIFSSFLIGVVSVLLIVVAVSSDSWIVSSASAQGQIRDNYINYGLFRGELEINILSTPVINTLYMTCVVDENACAVSCKTTPEARENEVRALAQGYRPVLGCNSDSTILPGDLLDPPPVISFAFYASTLAVIFLHLAFAVISSGLAIVNATRNPTEPIWGLPGCLWSNAITAVLGFTVLLMFGVYWATSGLKDHLAFSDTAQISYTLSQGLGYSYWLLIAAVIFSLCNVGLIELRKYLLERDPPPPTIKVENHSDGTIFLY
ncbi:uncharacterized protein LOC126377188 [Pectinophora gossypiella]|uniref:uncharacterized protein LOC126377188 n=1 Tax=Pectinophora gossypiella TaxID=13191 RepID=UPI00214F312D|nr:uncharacterized protein LOC126377188 [Pectinophora gossypiella]